jgi:hypothetical protein
MKKNFFKKLSFVLALAMIISVVAPAAGAFAASKIKLNATSKYLHLGVDGKDEYNFNISSKKGTGWKYAWESTNENVVVVNKKNGVVTATGVGTAKVTVFVTDKDGNEVGDATATVTVRDNIKELTITNKPAGDKLAVGAVNDFNRSFKTVSGSTKVTSAITRWSVEPADGASIDDKGVFTATKAGEYTITARAFQSKAKYQDWQKDPVANAAYLLADDTYKVTVAASMTGAKQVSLSKVNVTFNAPMEDVDKNIAIYQMVGETKVKHTISKVEMDADKKVATLSVFIPFATGATYVVEYPKMEAVSFKAATTNPEDVKSMTIATKEAVIDEQTPVDARLYNEEGVDITTDALLLRITMDWGKETGTYLTADKKILINIKGASTTVKAVYHTFKYDATGAEIGNVEAAGVIVGVDKPSTDITGVNAWTMDTSANWGNVNQKISIDDQNLKLFVKLNTKKVDPNTGTAIGTVDNSTNPSYFAFESSDKNILIVDPATGALYPVKAGEVTVIIKYNSAVGQTKYPVATVTITVGPKKAASSLSVSANDFIISNKLNDVKDVKLTVKDQLGRGFVFSNVKIERLSAPVVNGTVTPDHIIFANDGTTAANIGDNTFVANSNGEYTLKFNANGKTAGTYAYKVTIENLSQVIQVTVKTPADPSATPAYYRIELGTTTQDMKVNSWDNITTNPKKVSINVFGYSSDGVKLTDETLGAGQFTVKVEAPYDANGWFTSDNDVTTAEGGYVVVRTSGSAILKAPIGTYKVTAFKGTDTIPFNTVYFTTTDTQPKAVVNRVKNHGYTNTIASLTPTESTLIDAVDYAFEFAINGSVVSKSNIISVDATGDTATSIHVRSVVVREYTGGTGNYLDHKVDVGVTLNKK